MFRRVINCIPKDTGSESQRQRWRPQDLCCICAPMPGVDASGGGQTASCFRCGRRVGGKSSPTGSFSAPEVDWVCEPAPESNFGHHLPQFVNASGMIQHIN